MYQHGRKSKRKSGGKVFLQSITVLGLALVIGAYFLHKDLASSTSEKSTVPILTEVKDENADATEIREAEFSMKVPNGWTKTKRVQSNGANYYEYTTSEKGQDRKLLVHVGTMPEVYKITRLQPIYANGNKLRLGNLSSNCADFAGSASSGSNEPLSAKWENITFICDPIVNNQTIGTGTSDSGIATQVQGNSGSRKFFFYYEDHNIRPDDKILTDILRTFEAL